MSGAIDLAAVAKNPAVFNVIYPAGEQYKFDNEYYLKKHMPCQYSFHIKEKKY